MYVLYTNKLIFCVFPSIDCCLVSLAVVQCGVVVASVEALQITASPNHSACPSVIRRGATITLVVVKLQKQGDNTHDSESFNGRALQIAYNTLI